VKTPRPGRHEITLTAPGPEPRAWGGLACEATLPGRYSAGIGQGFSLQWHEQHVGPLRFELAGQLRHGRLGVQACAGRMERR
jgi:hypothetical protein